MSKTILLKNGAEIPNAERLMPLFVKRNGESVRVESSYGLLPGDLIEVQGVTGSPLKAKGNPINDKVEGMGYEKLV